MCQFGMQQRDAAGVMQPVQKPTFFLTSAVELAKALDRRCSPEIGHAHVQHTGARRTAHAAIYPDGLCRAILQGILAQRAREHKGVPAHVRKRLDAGTAVVDLEALSANERKYLASLRDHRDRIRLEMPVGRVRDEEQELENGRAEPRNPENQTSKTDPPAHSKTRSQGRTSRPRLLSRRGEKKSNSWTIGGYGKKSVSRRQCGALGNDPWVVSGSTTIRETARNPMFGAVG